MEAKININAIFVGLTLLIFVVDRLVMPVSVEQDLSMSFQEKQTLDKFRELMKPLLHQDYMKTDIYLIRWLRAKKFNLQQAEEMLKQNLRWREENKMDSIQSEDFTDMLQELPTSVDTQDMDGRPIGVVDFYNWNIRDTVLAGRGSRALRYLDMLLDNVTLQVFEKQKSGRTVTQFKVLGNAEGFNMITHGCPICVPYWIRFLGSLENHFPGWMDELIVIEAPFAVYTILEMVKPVLSRSTRESLRIFGADKKQWQAYLDKRVSKSERRASYGGTRPPLARDQQ